MDIGEYQRKRDLSNEEMMRVLMQNLIHNDIKSDDPVKERERLEQKYGKGNVYDTDEIRELFTIHGFLAPYCTATEISTGKKGLLTFQHHPRFYWKEKDIWEE